MAGQTGKGQAHSNLATPPTNRWKCKELPRGKKRHVCTHRGNPIPREDLFNSHQVSFRTTPGNRLKMLRDLESENNHQIRGGEHDTGGFWNHGLTKGLRFGGAQSICLRETRRIRTMQRAAFSGLFHKPQSTRKLLN